MIYFISLNLLNLYILNVNSFLPKSIKRKYFGKTHVKVYIHLKLLSQKCMRYDKNECENGQVNLYLTGSNYEEKFIKELSISENTLNLRSEKDFVTSVILDKSHKNILSIVSKSAKNIQLLNILDKYYHAYDTTIDFSDDQFKIIINCRIRILEYKTAIQKYFVAVVILNNMKIRNSYVESIKYLQIVSSIEWKELLQYSFVQNKLYFCVPDILRHINENGICTLDLLQNYKLTYKNTLLNNDNHILQNYYYRFNIEKDIILYIKNNNGPVKPHKIYRYDHIKLCNRNICYNDGECREIHFGEYIIMQCVCTPGYTGTLCENIVRCRYCMDNQCDIHGRCVRCNDGWTGYHCEKRTCNELNVCNGNGKCIEIDGHRTCQCDDGYVGRFCSLSCKRRDVCNDEEYCLVIHGRLICSKTKPTTTPRVPITTPTIGPNNTFEPYIPEGGRRLKPTYDINSVIKANINVGDELPGTSVKYLGMTFGVIFCLFIICLPMMIVILGTCYNCCMCQPQGNNAYQQQGCCCGYRNGYYDQGYYNQNYYY